MLKGMLNREAEAGARSTVSCRAFELLLVWKMVSLCVQLVVSVKKINND
jgi:hypothetical protein